MSKKNNVYNSTPRLISVAERVFSSKLQKKLIENNIDITVEQWRILFYLWQKDGINQQELARRAKKEKSTITRKINAIEKKGLIVRKSLLEDKRNKLIFLTEKGIKIKHQALEIAHSITMKAEQNIPSEHIKILKDTINKIMKNLE
ncbi:MarR family transcriptional regulator [Tenacibaculum sp. 190524A02b]